MAFKSDGGGTAIKLPDCKIGGMNWMTRLSQIGRWPEKKLIISTFSIPDFLETERLFAKGTIDTDMLEALKKKEVTQAALLDALRKER